MDEMYASYAAVGLLLLVYLIYKRITRISISHIPGPEPESWLLGNYRQLFQSQAGEPESKWHTEFGNVVRIKGPFGADRLLVADPKALQYIYNSGGYIFDSQPVRQELVRLLTGRGLVWATGEVHRRQRKVSSPAFGAAEARSYVPLFVKGASKLTEKWKSMLGENSSLDISVTAWLGRATLDVIGEAAFDYEFNCLFDASHVLANRYQTVLSETFSPPSSASILIQALMLNIPHRPLQWIFDYIPSKRLQPSREVSQVAAEISKTLMEAKKQEALSGDDKVKGKRDILSLLVRANAGLNKNAYLEDEEAWAMMMTIILAGHETTANTLTWGLLELAKQPDIQTKLRQEISETWKQVLARGDTEFSGNDFDDMKYTTAVVKEMLRFHPVAYQLLRESAKDQVLPLSKPVITKDGKIITEVPIPKGMQIFASTVVYNRDKEIFGEDANTFNPDRWLNHRLDKKLGTVGIYGNMMTFGSGARACIGWRFAVNEIHAFLVELIRNFEFSPTPELGRVRKEACLVMLPILEGEIGKGPQMPLKISLVNDDQE